MQLDSHISKSWARKHFQHKRASLAQERRKEASSACCKFLHAVFTENIHVVSFASKAEEIDLWPLNEYLAIQQQLLLPKVHGDFLELYKVYDCSSLELSSFCIKEPDESSSILSSFNSIDIVLVPGLCFDAKMHRIGYGAGYYDRLLSSIRKSCPQSKFWGVGYREQLTDTLLAIESHDVPLDDVLLF